MTDKRPYILLVDDNKHLLVTLSDFLRFEGMEVDLAKSGEEALARIDERAPELIVLDISMPGIGGLGFLKQIAKEDGVPKFPVLVLTARGAMQDYFSGLAVDGFLAKPCSEQDLLDKIREILTARRRQAERKKGNKAWKVALAEDDQRFSERIRDAFVSAAAPYELTVMKTGRELMEKVFTEPPDLVILKQVLHGMNGTEVLALLRLMPKTTPVPAILYSQDHDLNLGRADPRSFSGGEVRILSAAQPEDLMTNAGEMLARLGAEGAAATP